MSTKTSYLKSAFIAGMFALAKPAYSNANFNNFFLPKVNYEIVADSVIGPKKVYGLSKEELKKAKEKYNKISSEKKEKETGYQKNTHKYQRQNSNQSSKDKQGVHNKYTSKYRTQLNQDTINQERVPGNRPRGNTTINNIENVTNNYYPQDANKNKSNTNSQISEKKNNKYLPFPKKSKKENTSQKITPSQQSDTSNKNNQEFPNRYETPTKQDTENTAHYKTIPAWFYNKNEISDETSFGIYSSFNSDINLENKSLFVGPFVGFPINSLKGLELRLYAGANVFPGYSKSVEKKTLSGAPKQVSAKVYTQSNVVETKEKNFKRIGEAGISIVQYFGGKFAISGGVFGGLNKSKIKTNKSRIDDIFSYNSDGTKNVLQSKKDGSTTKKISKKMFSYGPTVGAEFYPARNLSIFVKGLYDIPRKKMGFSAGFSVPIKSPQQRGKFSRKVLKNE